MDDPRYWANLLVAGIVLPIWFAVVLGLAIATWAIAPWSRLGKLAAWTAVGLGIICCGYLALAAWYPPWYRPADDAVIRVVGFAVALSFYITFGSLIASVQKTEQGRRLAIKMTVVIGAAALGLTIAHAFLDGWLQALADVVFSVVIVGASILAHKAEMRSSSSPGNGPTGNVTQ